MSIGWTRQDDIDVGIRGITSTMDIDEITGSPWEAQLALALDELEEGEEMNDVSAFLAEPGRTPGLIALTDRRLIALGDRPMMSIRYEAMAKMRFRVTEAAGIRPIDIRQVLRLTTVDGETVIWDARARMYAINIQLFHFYREACPDASPERLAALDPDSG
jgi:hypothetical protein